MRVNINIKIILKVGFTIGLIGLLSGEIFNLLKDNVQQKETRKIKILNHIMPRSFDYLVEMSQGNEPFDSRKVKSYLYYYQKVSEYMPDRADAIGMTGFCLYQLGEKGQAIVAYEKALEVNPHFFWFYYNLGIIYLEQGKNQEAKVMFMKAKDIQPERVLFFIRNSKRIYMPLVMKRIKDIQKELTQQLKDDYRKCYVLTQLLSRDVSQAMISSMKLKIRMF